MSLGVWSVVVLSFILKNNLYLVYICVCLYTVCVCYVYVFKTCLTALLWVSANSECVMVVCYRLECSGMGMPHHSESLPELGQGGQNRTF